MLRPEDAWEKIASRLVPLPPIRRPRLDALGAVLAEDLVATVDQPQADVSAMDGYALAGEVAAEVDIEIVGRSVAGAPPDFDVPPGAAAKIMTGAVLPRGADRVVPVELSDGGDHAARFARITEPGAHIRRRGEVVRRGEPLLSIGTRLTPGAISLLASHGYGEVVVHPEPTVAVLTTGDEVVPPETEPGPGQLRDSNTSYLLAAGRSLGWRFGSLGIAPDRVDALRTHIADGMRRDVLLLCGGVSMGELDLVEDVLEELGCEKLFDQVAIQPGKPLVAARHGGGWVFGLPGNPASVMVTFQLFVRPLLRRLAGHPDGFWRGVLRAVLAGPAPASKGRDRFLVASIRRGPEGSLLALPHTPRGSHDVAAHARGTALVRVPVHGPAGTAGSICEILPLIHPFLEEDPSDG